MTAVTGVSGVGAILRRWNSSTSAWDTVAGIRSISGPNRSRATHDTTALDTAGGYRTAIGGLRDPGSITLDMIFDRAGFDTMNDDFDSDTVQNYEIILPDTDATSLEFEGLVTELPLEIPEAPITMRVTIKLTGSVTVNSGSAGSVT